MSYRPNGRLTKFEEGSTSEDYFYDAMGMRVLVNNADKQTLYFYDPNNTVLSEYVNGQWDRSYINFNGGTAVTYESEHDLQAAGSVVPAITVPEVIEKGLLTWDGSEGLIYDLQVIDEFDRMLQDLSGLREPQRQLAATFKYGRYRMRVRLKGQPWSPWREFLHMDPSSRDRAGDYPLDGSLNDASFYRNHASSNAFPSEGYQDLGLTFTGSQSLVIQNPYRLKPADLQGSFSFRFKTSINANVRSSMFLAGYGGFKLQLFNGTKLLGRTPTGGYVLTQGTAPVDQWHQVVVIHGQGNVKIYLDGSLVANGPLPATTHTTLELGASSGEIGFNGVIDEVKVFNRALTAAEITAAETN